MTFKPVAAFAMLVTTFGLAPAGVVPAFAHAMLVTAAPADQAMVSPAPAELRLTFSEGVELAFSAVDVTGPEGKSVEAGPPALDAADGKVLVVPLAARLVPGTYEVDWSVVASDGHKSSGRYSFTVTVGR